jgi:hypothetical protein
MVRQKKYSSIDSINMVRPKKYSGIPGGRNSIGALFSMASDKLIVLFTP